MKKVFGIAALLLALAACNKIETGNLPAENTEGIPFTASISLGDNAATKALAENGSTITATWEVGEKVALIHNGVKDEMTVSSIYEGSATITGTITGSPADGDPVTIIYPSSAADGTTGNIKADLLYAQNGLLTGEGSISKNYDARKGSGTLKVAGTATLDGRVSLTNQFAIFKFTVRGADGTTAISAKPLKVTIGTQDYVITPAAATDVLYAVLPAVSGEKVSFDATDGSDRTYTCAKLNANFEAGKYYQSTLKMREYVDLGTGVKWATCNVGAENPWDYGDYFAWGATMPYYKAGHSQDSPCNDWIDGKDGYNWKSYPFMEDGQSSWKRITKYTFADGQTDGTRWYDGTTFKGDNGDGVEHRDFASYGYADDAARANWGGKWRTPTDAEWTWLRENCTWTWTNDYLGDGSNKAGRIVTSNVNGNVIFLPAAGFRNNDYYLNSPGILGVYWSSSLFEDISDDARFVYFYFGEVYRSNVDRYYGQSVRPVTE